MTRRKIILLSSIAVLATVFTVQVLLDNRDPVRVHSIPERSTPDTLILTRPGVEPITLVRDESELERWRIKDSGFPADPMRVRGLLDAISSIREIARVSDGRGIERYGLDEASVTVLEAWRGDTLVRRLEAGNAAPSWAQTYARIDSKPSVLLVAGALGSTLNITPVDLRDRQLWQLEPTDLAGIESTGKDSGQSFVLKKIDTNWQLVTPDGRTFETDPETLATWMNNFVSLRADSFAEDVPMPVEGQLASFTIRTGDSGYRLFIHSRDEEKGYLCTASVWPWPFYLRDATVGPMLSGYAGLVVR